MPKDLIEIRWHGRGGQGAKTAAQFLAEAALDKGQFIQAFPEYGPERAGAPMKVFTRISSQPINLHCGITNPQIAVVIDPTLLDAVDVTEGLGEEGILLVNSQESPQAIKEKLSFSEGKLYTVDATRIALETIGLSFPNTPMLGALLKITGLVSLEVLKEKIKGKFAKKLSPEKLKGNIDAVERGYKEVRER